MTVMNKRQWRIELRSRHEGQETRCAQSSLLCRHILNSDAYQTARVVAGYMPMAYEADVMEILQDVLQSGKILALPLCEEPPHMTLRQIDSLTVLATGAYGILEPPKDTPIIPVHDVDLMLVPLEGIDKHGYRLGKGGGFYDHLLAQVSAMTIGCALSWQWEIQLPRDEWDIPLMACVDWNGVHYF